MENDPVKLVVLSKFGSVDIITPCKIEAPENTVPGQVSKSSVVVVSSSKDVVASRPKRALKPCKRGTFSDKVEGAIKADCVEASRNVTRKFNFFYNCDSHDMRDHEYTSDNDRIQRPGLFVRSLISYYP